MKITLAVICLIGIAVVSSAPVENEAQAAASQQEAAQERAVKISQNPAVEERAAEIPQEPAAEERAAEIPQEPAAEERAAETPASFEERAASSHTPYYQERVANLVNGIQERGFMPSPKEIIAAVEDKYLTPDGKALLKSLLRGV